MVPKVEIIFRIVAQIKIKTALRFLPDDVHDQSWDQFFGFEPGLQNWFRKGCLPEMKNHLRIVWWWYLFRVLSRHRVRYRLLAGRHHLFHRHPFGGCLSADRRLDDWPGIADGLCLQVLVVFILFFISFGSRCTFFLVLTWAVWCFSLFFWFNLAFLIPWTGCHKIAIVHHYCLIL
jgi:hypothetical protein